MGNAPITDSPEENKMLKVEARASREGRNELLKFFRAELANFLDDEVRAHAAEHAHLIAREVGPKRVVEALEQALLPRETSDQVWRALAKTLGAREFSESAGASCLLHWLLEMPEPGVRREAVHSVLLHAHRGEPLLAFPGAIDVSAFDTVPSVDGLKAASAGQQRSPTNANNNLGDKSPSTSKNNDIVSPRSARNGPEAQASPGCLLLPYLSDPGAFKSFFQRISVCEILAEPIPTGMTPDQEVDLIAKLGKDPVPMVRAAVASNLGSLAHKAAVKAARSPKKPAMSSPKASRPDAKKKKNAEGASAVMTVPLELSASPPKSGICDTPPQFPVPEVLVQRKMPLPLVRDLMADPDDLVQALAIKHCLAQFILEMQTPDDKVHFLHVLKENFVHSNSWRTRFALAEQLGFLLQELSKWDPGSAANPRGDPVGQSPARKQELDDDAENLPDAVAKVDLGSARADIGESPHSAALDGNGSDFGAGFAGAAAAVDAENSVQAFQREELQFLVMELFSDPEPEVRAAAAKHFEHFFANPAFAPLLEKLVCDEDVIVRRAILKTFPSLAHMAPERIANMLHHLISDDPEPDVRTEAVQLFFRADFLRALPKQLCLSLLPQIYGAVFWSDAEADGRSNRAYSSATDSDAGDFSAASSWRAKDAAIGAVHEVVKVLSDQEWTHQANGVNFLIQCLKNPVRKIRATAVAQIPAIAERYGHEWVHRNLGGIPQVLIQDPAADYKVRITALELIEQLVRVQCSSATLEQLVRNAAQNDSVKNVRAKARELLQL